MYLVKSLILKIIFLILVTTTSNNYSFFYNHPLSYTLLREDTNAFLNKSKNINDQTFQEMIKSALDSLSLELDKFGLLLDLENKLEMRIKRIESFKNKRYDYKSIRNGCISIAISSGLNYLLYISYKKWYTQSKSKFNFIKKEFQQQGMRVETFCGALFVSGRRFLNSHKLNTLFQAKINLNNLELVLGWGSAVSLIIFIYGLGNLLIGLNPHNEDQFLDTYQRQLSYIKELKSTMHYF
ncbi:MAG: hypothetical protein ACOYT8_05215 [Candidatus Dependentiae bacterium]